ncbi:MAG: Asp-tRNA(Asn)/Glu-tRNA(Gln) amidotransferase subunit GatC [Deltaproteobacteria bacterium]|nr:Asp-tRNA(Asn)/Glu-tRNA(Gln) amidotransferase subunit GatC [Deltaproteobacteria bacterium]
MTTTPAHMDDAIEHVAELAKLKFPDDVREHYARKLQMILESMKKLNDIDVSHITPTSHAVNAEGSLRPDEAKPSGIADALLQLAPERDGPFVQVPKVIDAS